MKEIRVQEKEAVTGGESMQNKEQKTDKNSSRTKDKAEDMRRKKLVEQQSEVLKAETTNYKERIRHKREKANVTAETIPAELNK